PQQTRHGFEERFARRQSVPPTAARRILHPNMSRACIVGVVSAVAGDLLGHGPLRSPKLGSDGRQGQPITESKLDLHPLHSRQSYAISCHRTILSNVVRWCFLSNLNPPSKNHTPGFTVVYNVSGTSGASVEIHDIVTARTRAGWTFDRFLPYGFAGVAVGRADVSRFAT